MSSAVGKGDLLRRPPQTDAIDFAGRAAAAFRFHISDFLFPVSLPPRTSRDSGDHPMKKPLDFNFTRALLRGAVSYDATVGAWWESQAADEAHKRAYRHAAEYVRDTLRKARVKSPLIVDYACGGGHFMLELLRLMPDARVVGLDGSKKLLALTAARCEAAGVDAAVLPG